MKLMLKNSSRFPVMKSSMLPVDALITKSANYIHVFRIGPINAIIDFAESVTLTPSTEVWLSITRIMPLRNTRLSRPKVIHWVILHQELEECRKINLTYLSDCA